MPLPGGATDKFGNRYEGIWTVRCMADVLAGRAESIRLEPPGADGEGIEFWLKNGDSLQYHQVKRQNSPKGNWTIADLGNKGVLGHFWDKLQDPLSSCVFVSTNSAFQLEELSDRSKRSASFIEFSREFIKAKSVYDAFAELRARWNDCSEQEAYLALQRIEVENIGERTLRSTAERELGVLIDGNTANVTDVLAQFSLDRVHHELRTEDIWTHLQDRGFPRRQSSRAESIIGDFACPAPLYFVGRVETLQELINAISHNSIVAVEGLAGIGKTYLVSRYIENLDISKTVLWLDCGIYGHIERALIRLAEFLSYKLGDETLLGFLRSPLSSVERRIEVAAAICDKHECTLVLDGFDPEKHQTLLPLLQECNRIFHRGRILITTRTSLDFTMAINPIYKLTVPPLAQEAGIELMRHYFVRLGFESYSYEILVQAHERVDGHPYFLRALVILSETYPLPDILRALPQFQAQIQSYIQEQVFGQLTEGSKSMVARLSVLRTPFLLPAIHHFHTTSDASNDSAELFKKFLVTRQAKNSSYYEIHDLVREHGLSLLSDEQTRLAHALARDYYESLEQKTYSDGIESVHHSLEADMQDRALGAAEQLVSHALHDGLFDFVAEYTTQILQDKRAENWGVIHFAKGRALRFKERITDALQSYENALAHSGNERLADSSKLEIASMLIKQGEKHNKERNISRAKKLYEELAQSKNVETQVAGLTSLGYINIKGKKHNKGISQLRRALALAENVQLKRGIMQICQGLGAAYADSNRTKAIQYLERAHALRQETRSEYGEQDIEADYHLFDALASVYRAQKRFEDAIRASDECVSIDRRLNLQERLAHSLFQLGKDNCLLRRYDRAKSILQESLSLIRKLELHGEPESATLEWLATALWNSRQFENAIETILEHILLTQHTEGFSIKHVVIREADLANGNKADSADFVGTTVHVLILPGMYEFGNLQQWNQRIVSRRPELAAVNPLLFYRR